MNQSCLGRRVAPLLTTLLCLSLAACERPPVAQVELRGVPSGAATVEVWTWVDSRAATSALRYPIDAPREVQRLGLRLSAMDRGELQVGLGAFDQAGCLLALGEGRGVVQGADVIVRTTLDAVPKGSCGAARPLISSAAPATTRTLAREPLTLRGLGFAPGMSVQVGGVEVPLVKALSPTQMSGALPALPGRVGVQAVTVHDDKGAKLAVAPTALALMLSELRFEAALFPAQGQLRVLENYGRLSTVPGTAETGGRDSLIQLSYRFEPKLANPNRFPPALLLRSIPASPALGADFYARPFPFLPGAPLYVAVADLNGDGVQDEVLVSACSVLSGATCDPNGTESYVAAYRIKGTNIAPLGEPLVLTQRRNAATVPSATQGHVRPALNPRGQGVAAREGVILNWLVLVANVAKSSRAFEYRLKDGDVLEEIPVGPDDWTAPFAVAPFAADGALAALQGCCAGFYFLPRLDAPLFKPVLTTPALNGSVAIAAGDIDGDGKLDVLDAQATGGVGVWRNATPSALTEELRLETGDLLPCGKPTTSVAAADLDGDGRVEVICGGLLDRPGAPGNKQDGLVIYTFMPNRGAAGAAGGFLPVPVSVPLGSQGGGGPTSIATGDFDGDGRMDVVTNANIFTDGLLFLLNRSQ